MVQCVLVNKFGRRVSATACGHLFLSRLSQVVFAHTASKKKGGEKIKKILTHSPAEVLQLLKQGYKLDSMGYFPSGSGASYTLIKN